jgi:hypothetical protein
MVDTEGNLMGRDTHCKTYERNFIETQTSRRSGWVGGVDIGKRLLHVQMLV